MRVSTLLKRIPPEQDLLRRCLERAQAEYGPRLPAAEVFEALEDADLGILWRRQRREVCLCVRSDELRVRRCRYAADGGRDVEPDWQLDDPEQLVGLLGWLYEPSDPYES